ncbi:uncharacterized protein LOC131438575 isoform X2 [Malaya genurostris]|uniref:uncharacterized protein LOC131438575 isoform X2 n=1 Tax=Malaya genurostris TaxID=325434 RepID=UPI0026F3C12C|nr:uncharacterized protein LOC131438575 isoform X2 [Malaya genurostris]
MDSHDPFDYTVYSSLIRDKQFDNPNEVKNLYLHVDQQYSCQLTVLSTKVCLEQVYSVSLRSIISIEKRREITFPVSNNITETIGIQVTKTIVLPLSRNISRNQNHYNESILMNELIIGHIKHFNSKTMNDNGNNNSNRQNMLSISSDSKSPSNAFINKKHADRQHSDSNTFLYSNNLYTNLEQISTIAHNMEPTCPKRSPIDLSTVANDTSSLVSSTLSNACTGKKFTFDQNTQYKKQHNDLSKTISGIRTNSLICIHQLRSKDDCFISKTAVQQEYEACDKRSRFPRTFNILEKIEMENVAHTPESYSPKTLNTRAVLRAKSFSNSHEFLVQPSDVKVNPRINENVLDNNSSANLKLRNEMIALNNSAVDEAKECNKCILSQSLALPVKKPSSLNMVDSPFSPTLISSKTSLISSASATSAIENTTTNAIVYSSKSGRLTYSSNGTNECFYQKSLHRSYHADLDGNMGNSYFRFPDVDSFTPPNSVQLLNRGWRSNTDFKTASFVTHCVSPEGIFSNDMLLTQPQVSSAENTDLKLENPYAASDESIQRTIDDSLILESNKDNTISVNQTVRRARLKSISLDSEGARLVEEHLSISIPVEELVGIASSKSASEKHPTHFSNSNASEIGEDLFSLNKKRNIFNLTLNLNHKDETLSVVDDCKFNEFYFEYYDYDDDGEEYDMGYYSRINSNEKRKKNFFHQQTPIFIQNRTKASSLDLEQCFNNSIQSTKIQNTAEDCVQENSMHSPVLNPSTSIMSTSSLSVPTTPKRMPYRLQHQQHHGKFKQSRCTNDNVTGINNSPAIERYTLCGFHKKLGSFDENVDNYCSSFEDDSDSTNAKYSLSFKTKQSEENVSVANISDKAFPDITPVCDFVEKVLETKASEKPPIQTLNKNRSNILQRRGSNQSLTLNLDGGVEGCLNKGLSASNYSLGNYRESHLSLAGSSYNLQQQQQLHQGNHSNVNTVQTKKNLLQRRGSNTSLVLNLQSSNTSLNRYTSHSSLNIQNQQIRSSKKGLLERRNSNTSLTHINVQSRTLSASNCNLPSSAGSLNSIATNQTQNEVITMDENDHQLSNNKNKTNNCIPTMVSASNESHLSPNCQQHGQRRKFLSSDSLHNIVNQRAECCCQQKETEEDNKQICCRARVNMYGGSGLYH